MSSEPEIPATSPLASAVATLGWLVVAAALALGGAGLVGELTHPPGGASREELTYRDDHALAVRLDDATARIQTISGNVERMATAAKSALAAISSADAAGLRTNLERGNGAATLIASAVSDLRDSLAGLPGDGPDAAFRYSNATLVRRAAILAALDSANGLAAQWAQVTGRSTQAARLVQLLQDHETTVVNAAVTGVAAHYADAVAMLQQAKIRLEDIDSLRSELVSGGQVTVLDEWLARHARYDNALISLYHALQTCACPPPKKISLDVQAAAREELLARDQLPADDRSIIAIIAQIAEGGLNQAVLAVEDARGRIDAALSEASPG